MNDALLLFLGRAGGIARWLRLAGGSVAGRGDGADGAAQAGGPIVAVAPGEGVTLRWVDLPAGLAPAQAAAAARLMAAEMSAEPIDDLHVAAGADEGGARCVGLVSAEAMSGWLTTLADHGFDPDRIVPETLLLNVPEQGLAVHSVEGLGFYRGPGEAFAAEPELAGQLLAGRAVVDIDEAEFEAGLPTALAEAPLDLRQGPFARRRDWRVAPARARRLAVLAAALLLVSLAVQVADIARYIFAADAADAETRRIAAAALPRFAGAADGSALTQRLAELRGGGAGFSATAGAVFDAVKATPNVELSAIAFSPDGALRTTVQADSPAAIEALGRRIEGSGFTVEAGPSRAGGGRRIADLMVQPR